jgi:hypothetical protein
MPGSSYYKRPVGKINIFLLFRPFASEVLDCLDGKVCIKSGFFGPLCVSEMVDKTMEFMLRTVKLTFLGRNLIFFVNHFIGTSMINTHRL